MIQDTSNLANSAVIFLAAADTGDLKTPKMILEDEPLGGATCFWSVQN